MTRQHRERAQRVAIDHNDIRECAGSKRAEQALRAQDLGTDGCSRANILSIGSTNPGTVRTRATGLCAVRQGGCSQRRQARQARLKISSDRRPPSITRSFLPRLSDVVPIEQHALSWHGKQPDGRPETCHEARCVSARASRNFYKQQPGMALLMFAFRRHGPTGPRSGTKSLRQAVLVQLAAFHDQ